MELCVQSESTVELNRNEARIEGQVRKYWHRPTHTDQEYNGKDSSVHSIVGEYEGVCREGRGIVSILRVARN